MNELELIINKYAAAIVNYHMALDEDYKKANKYFSQAEKHLCELKLIENWIEDFQHLLDHENVTTTQLYAKHKENVKRDLVNNMEWELESNE